MLRRRTTVGEDTPPKEAKRRKWSVEDKELRGEEEGIAGPSPQQTVEQAGIGASIRSTEGRQG